jgi:biopolymer transport protein ExbB/TolQ
VSQGIAAALVATAAGLLVAIYAIIAYNYFISRVGAIAVEYKVFCEEFLLALGEYANPRQAPPAVAGAVPPPTEKNAPPS